MKKKILCICAVTFLFSIFLASFLSPAKAAAPKIQFQYIFFPTSVFVDTADLDAGFCFVNHGASGELIYDGTANFDEVSISIPVGVGSDKLILDSSVLSWTTSADWSCTIDTSGVIGGEGKVLLIFYPNGTQSIAAGDTICFDISGLNINSDVGLAISPVDQQFDAARAEKEKNGSIGVFKAGDVSGTVELDPTVAESVKDGVDWSELTGIPADIADGDDGITTETDPLFSSSPAYGVTNTQITNWDSAFSWGDHSLGGYLTTLPLTIMMEGENISLLNNDAGYLNSYTETDPTVNLTKLQSLVSNDFHNLGGVDQDTKLSDADIGGMGYIKTDTQLSEAQVDNYVANNGYLTSESDPTVLASVKDGVSWSEIASIPAGFADGIDDGGTDTWRPKNTDYALQAADGSPTNVVYVTGSGRVGIGMTNPSAKLEVAGSSDSNEQIAWFRANSSTAINTIRVFGNQYNYGSSIEAFVGHSLSNFSRFRITTGYGYAHGLISDAANNANSLPIYFQIGNKEVMRITTSGYLGIGTNSPGVPLEVVSSRSGGGATDTMRWRAPNKGSNVSHVHWNTWGDWYIRPAHNYGRVYIRNYSGESDISNKENIEDNTYGLSSVMDLRPVMFSWKETDGSLKNIGFIAQEVELIIPELVSGEEGSKGLSYDGVAAILVKAVQELKTENDALKADNITLGQEIEQIKAVIGL